MFVLRPPDALVPCLEVRKYSTNQDAIKMLVANKVDKEDQTVTRAEGEEFAIASSMLFIETSAKTRQGVKQAFEEVVLKILDCPNLVASPRRTRVVGGRVVLEKGVEMLACPSGGAWQAAEAAGHATSHAPCAVSLAPSVLCRAISSPASGLCVLARHCDAGRAEAERRRRRQPRGLRLLGRLRRSEL